MEFNIETYYFIACIIATALSLIGYAYINESIIHAQEKYRRYSKKKTIQWFTLFFISAAVTLLCFIVFLFYEKFKIVLLLSVTVTTAISVFTFIKYKLTESYFKQIQIAVDEVDFKIKTEKQHLIDAVIWDINKKVRSETLKKELLNSLMTQNDRC